MHRFSVAQQLSPRADSNGRVVLQVHATASSSRAPAGKREAVPVEGRVLDPPIAAADVRDPPLHCDPQEDTCVGYPACRFAMSRNELVSVGRRGRCHLADSVASAAVVDVLRDRGRNQAGIWMLGVCG